MSKREQELIDVLLAAIRDFWLKQDTTRVDKIFAENINAFSFIMAQQAYYILSDKYPIDLLHQYFEEGSDNAKVYLEEIIENEKRKLN